MLKLIIFADLYKCHIKNYDKYILKALQSIIGIKQGYQERPFKDVENVLLMELIIIATVYLCHIKLDFCNNKSFVNIMEIKNMSCNAA